MKKITLFLAISSLLALLSCSGESTDNAQLEADISPVLPKVNSTVIAIKVEDNQYVKKGDTLVILDDATFKIAVQQAEVALAQAKKNVNLADIGKSSATVSISNTTAASSAISANLSASKSAIESAREQLSFAEKNLNRYKKLLDQNSATQQQFDRIKAEKSEAEARLQASISQRDALMKQLDASRYEIENSNNRLSSSSENISLAQLSVKQAENTLNAAKLQLSYCTITSPVNGIISRKNVQIGQVVSSGTPLMAVASNNKIWVIANFKETQIEKMKQGQKVDIEVDAYPDAEINGKVQSIAQATGAKFSFLPADNATGNFVKVTQRVPVKITIENYDNKEFPLKAGMSVKVKVKTN